MEASDMEAAGTQCSCGSKHCWRFHVDAYGWMLCRSMLREERLLRCTAEPFCRLQCSCVPHYYRAYSFTGDPACCRTLLVRRRLFVCMSGQA
jgi:hypothetical protein